MNFYPGIFSFVFHYAMFSKPITWSAVFADHSLVFNLLYLPVVYKERSSVKTNLSTKFTSSFFLFLWEISLWPQTGHEGSEQIQILWFVTIKVLQSYEHWSKETKDLLRHLKLTWKPGSILTPSCLILFPSHIAIILSWCSNCCMTSFT